MTHLTLILLSALGIFSQLIDEKSDAQGAEPQVCDSPTAKAEPCSDAHLLLRLAGVARGFFSSLHVLKPGSHFLGQISLAS